MYRRYFKSVSWQQTEIYVFDVQNISVTLRTLKARQASKLATSPKALLGCCDS